MPRRLGKLCGQNPAWSRLGTIGLALSVCGSASLPNSSFIRRLTTTSTAPSPDGTGNHAPAQAASSLNIDLPPIPGHRKPNAKNIIVNDLQATLQAHQRANGQVNEQVVVRKIGTPKSKVEYNHQPLKSAQMNVDVMRWRFNDGHLKTHQREFALETPHEGHDPQRLLSDREAGLDASPGREDTIFQPKGAPLNPQIKPEQKSAQRGGQLSRISKILRVMDQPSGDYKGEDQQPKGQWSLNSVEKSSTRPWLANLASDYSGDGYERLHKEIQAFEQYMNSTVAEENATRGCIQNVKNLIEKVFPGHDVTVHGSRATGYAVPSSDVDFSINVPGFDRKTFEIGPRITRPESKRMGLKLLETLREALHNDRRYSRIDLVHAEVPIVRAIDTKTGLHLQFQTLAPIAGALEYSKFYLQDIPSLRPLFFVLRHVLQIRDLNTVFTGGLSSYPLLIMIVAALKDPKCRAKDDFGTQLLHILGFYYKADFSKVGFSAEPAREFEKRLKDAPSGDPILDTINAISPDRPYLLCLQDPADPTNDLGRKSHKIKHITRVFQKSRDRLWYTMGIWNRTAVKSRAAVQMSLLAPLIGANYSHFEIERQVQRGERSPQHIKIPQKILHLVPYKGRLRLKSTVKKSQPVLAEVPKSDAGGRGLVAAD